LVARELSKASLDLGKKQVSFIYGSERFGRNTPYFFDHSWNTSTESFVGIRSRCPIRGSPGGARGSTEVRRWRWRRDTRIRAVVNVKKEYRMTGMFMGKAETTSHWKFTVAYKGVLP
jgi:hypothetical protein